MRIKEALGINLTSASDYLIIKTMEVHGISRRDARRLLGEALVRTCVVEEIIETQKALIIKKNN